MELRLIFLLFSLFIFLELNIIIYRIYFLNKECKTVLIKTCRRIFDITKVLLCNAPFKRDHILNFNLVCSTTSSDIKKFSSKNRILELILSKSCRSVNPTEAT